MKKLIYIGLLQVLNLQASWIVVKINNQSDLIFTQAARNQNVNIASISQIFKNSQGLNSIILPSDALFGTSGGCKIIAQTPQNLQVEILFFGDFTHRVANGRASFANLAARNVAATLHSPMIAAVFQLEQGVMQLIGYTGFDDVVNQPFQLNLTGSGGNYQAQLVSA